MCMFYDVNVDSLEINQLVDSFIKMEECYDTILYSKIIDKNFIFVLNGDLILYEYYWKTYVKFAFNISKTKKFTNKFEKDKYFSKITYNYFNRYWVKSYERMGEKEKILYFLKKSNCNLKIFKKEIIFKKKVKTDNKIQSASGYKDSKGIKQHYEYKYSM